MGTLRHVLPLAACTATSMLAMDLVLPALPTLQQALGGSVAQGQAVVSAYLAGLALSQLLWGEALNRLGPRRCLLWGSGGLAVTAAGCALAPGLDALLVLRLLQGLAAGAGTVVVTSLARATLGDADAVRAIAAIGAVESMVPAAAPVVGALLLPHTGWRVLFGIVALAALAVLPLVLRIAPPRLPGLDATQRAGYAQILRNPRFVRLALAHALSMGALFTLVASAPQVMVGSYGLEGRAFALLQVVGVAGFAITASQAGRLAARWGSAASLRRGAWAQLLLCAGLAAGAAAGTVPYALLAAFWCAFCAAGALRWPTSFALALDLPAAQLGRASALMVLGLLAAGAAGTQVVAPFIAGPSPLPLALALLAMTAASAALVSGLR